MLAPLQPFPAKAMAAYPVSTAVNDRRNEGAGLITPLSPSNGSAGQWWESAD